MFPLVDGLFGNAVALGQHAGSVIAGCDLGTHGRRGAGVLVQGSQHGCTPELDLSTLAEQLWP